MTLTTTLNAIRRCGPCADEWNKLLIHLGKTKADDEPVSFLTILESNGLDDTLWWLRTLPKEMDNAVRLLVCEIVEPLLEFVPVGESRPRKVIETARAFAKGEVTREELDAAVGAAADVDGPFAKAAAKAAARDARNEVYTAAEVAAKAAARDAWLYAEDATEDDWLDAEDAAEDAARAEQETIFRNWLAQFDQVEAA
ncbi:hypothetical protein [Roseibium sp. RKSG952]|uniref:hypothetical protein n=1 Tax=Roseibium sp. RKSG952 TaxID=2529384 RepID=UPI0012BC5DD7|nr:hypothetical protein [Roseibium sp. RKSG952]MTH96549.1 hypothetical protein [Roseibium sp. RKSG952]